MGGAFVAVADDSSATWWNPAGLAAGAFLDVAIARAAGASWFTAATPPVGVSYYRFRAADNSTESGVADREDRRVEVPAMASQLGATFVQTLVDGVHAGVTVKYVRGVAGARSAATADLDIGLLGAIGAVRVGVVARNLRAPELAGVRLDRQLRVGAAFDAAAAGGPPVMVALDVDLREYLAASGRRRVLAVGAERWLMARRVGVRTGVRVNTVGARETAATAGLSVAVRSGVYVDAHGQGGSGKEGAWGIAGRLSF
jgi:hypothetical protein